jgi:hypothetical protein
MYDALQQLRVASPSRNEWHQNVQFVQVWRQVAIQFVVVNGGSDGCPKEVKIYMALVRTVI